MRMVSDWLNDDGSNTRSGVIKEMAPRLGVAYETLRRRVTQEQVDAGKRPGVSLKNLPRSGG